MNIIGQLGVGRVGTWSVLGIVGAWQPFMLRVGVSAGGAAQQTPLCHVWRLRPLRSVFLSHGEIKVRWAWEVGSGQRPRGST